MPSPAQFLKLGTDPGLKMLASIQGPPVSNEARRFLLCTAMQESGPNLDARYQNSPSVSPGPARGPWQFEQGGGIHGVMTHVETTHLAHAVCDKLVVVHDDAAVWRSIEGSVMLACCFARLLLLTDPYPIPTTMSDGWECYERLWRPGQPHPETWEDNWMVADQTVKANPVNGGEAAATATV